MTPKTLADALGCFWNAAIGAAHNRQSSNAMDLASVLAEGVAAVAARLEEHEVGESRRITELLEANNRYQQEAQDARNHLKAVVVSTGLTSVSFKGPKTHGEVVEEAERLLQGFGLLPEDPPSEGPQAIPPTPPWTPGARDNGKIEGWLAYFTGRDRESCPFPKARADLQRDFRVGWDAAQAHQRGTGSAG